ncbi:MAG: hypothetical protein JWO88_2842 [Frankiales bacterium]|nr:hypothetical protein [Frankiales bacterium]
MSTSPYDGPHWLPVLVRRPRPEEPVGAPYERIIEWAWAEGARLSEPFFAETVDRLLRRPFNRLLRPRTGLDGLHTFAAMYPSLPLRGIVAHVSRCGSTLVSSWLAAADSRLALSEPSPLDAVLRLGSDGISHEEHIALVRAVVAALAQARGGTERSAYVKLDAWNSAHLGLLRTAFPDAPVLALARDPVEVLVSSERLRGAHMVPGALPPEIFGMSWSDVTALPPADYMARVQRSILTELTEGPADLYVDFADLPARRAEILELFDVDADAESAELDVVSGRHAKAPERSYIDDRAAKQAAAAPDLREAADRVAGPAYAHFLRLARPEMVTS